jgi:hypothetical protein
VRRADVTQSNFREDKVVSPDIHPVVSVEVQVFDEGRRGTKTWRSVKLPW